MFFLYAYIQPLQVHLVFLLKYLFCFNRDYLRFIITDVLYPIIFVFVQIIVFV